MVAFYQHDIANWMNGTESLSDGEYRVYHVMCELMYQSEGPIAMHESGIAGRCNQHVLKFRHHFRSLVERGKLKVLENGKVTNLRVEQELVKIATKRRKPPGNPQATPDQPPPGTQGVARGSAGGKANKPLKTKDPPPLDDASIKTIETIKKDSEAKASAKTRLEIERKELFDRGKQVLGQEAGGLIAKLLAFKHGNIALARAAIEQASTMDDPKVYVCWIVRGGKNGQTQNADGSKLGFAGIAARIRRNALGETGRPSPDDLEPVNRHSDPARRVEPLEGRRQASPAVPRFDGT
jgi:hypothetical protein